MSAGILGFGAYVPWRRLQRKAVVDAHGWFNSALKSQGKGERAMANWDEDAVTMAVEAARDALTGFDRSGVAGLRVASTTFPFLDRLNAGIVADAPRTARADRVMAPSSSARAQSSGPAWGPSHWAPSDGGR